MLIKFIAIIILTAGVLFSQIDTRLKYSDEQDGNEIDLIITKPVKLKDKKTGEFITVNTDKKISGVSKIISMNDTSINVWNGKSKIVELDKINAIRIEDPNKPNYILTGSLSGLGLGIFTGYVIGSSKEVKGDIAGLTRLENGITGALYGGLIGLFAGALFGFILDGLVDTDYITISLNNFTNEKKMREIEYYINSK